MSRFATYCEWIVTARKCLDGEPPPGHLAKFHLWKGLVEFPLTGVEPCRCVAQFYEELLTEVEGSRLENKRKELYRRFTYKIVAAHAAVEDIQTPIGTVSKLRRPLALVHEALSLMTELKEYDDEHPVHWFEVFPAENTRCRLSPKDLWLHFKLESIRPCLVFLVRLFRLVFPDCSDMWDECERSLTREQWILQFILDSPKPPKVSPTSPHILRDIVLAHQAKLAAMAQICG